MPLQTPSPANKYRKMPKNASNFCGFFLPTPCSSHFSEPWPACSQPPLTVSLFLPSQALFFCPFSLPIVHLQFQFLLAQLCANSAFSSSSSSSPRVPPPFTAFPVLAPGQWPASASQRQPASKLQPQYAETHFPLLNRRHGIGGHWLAGNGRQGFGGHWTALSGDGDGGKKGTLLPSFHCWHLHSNSPTSPIPIPIPIIRRWRHSIHIHSWLAGC
jgi:hypothetical protein